MAMLTGSFLKGNERFTDVKIALLPVRVMQRHLLCLHYLGTKSASTPDVIHTRMNNTIFNYIL